MRVLVINCVCGIRSTGRICSELADQFIQSGDEVRIAYGRMDEVPERYRELAVRIGDRKDLAFHMLQTRLFDQHGFGSTKATRRFLDWAEEYRPDLVWIHNIHGYYINVELLFGWIKRHPQMQVKWTLHDCWAFTGHCAYFTAVKCEQWREECIHCPQLKEYPVCYGPGDVKHNYERKRRAFTGVSHMTLITPSQWLADLVKQSYLKEYPVEVHYNTVNTEVFRPTQSEFREEYGLQDKKVVLGVASTWDTRKGLRDLCQLAWMLDEQYAIVVVGLAKEQIKKLPRWVRDSRMSDRDRCGAKFSNLAMQNTLLSNGDFHALEESGELVNKTVDTDKVDIEVSAETIVNAEGDMAIEPSVYELYCAITGEEYLEGDVNQTKGKVTNRVPCRVLGLPKTNCAEELAGIYTAADVFVNPTYEDNYPTVNLEARACGTRVVTYDTGGCRETLR